MIRERPTRDEGEDQAEQGGEVLEQDHRQLRLLGPPDELRRSDASPLILLVSLIAVRNDSDSITMATRSTTSGTHHHLLSRMESPGVRGLVDLVELVVRLVEREQATDAEQHDRRR